MNIGQFVYILHERKNEQVLLEPEDLVSFLSSDNKTKQMAKARKRFLVKYF